MDNKKGDKGYNIICKQVFYIFRKIFTDINNNDFLSEKNLEIVNNDNFFFQK